MKRESVGYGRVSDEQQGHASKREAISFGRFSSKPQEEGDSTTRQREAYERVCERYKDRCQPSPRYGFGTFFGAGESGYSGKHLKKGGSLRKLLDLMQDGTIDPSKSVLVIEAFDRLGRIAPDLAIGLLSDIVRSGCAIAVASPDVYIASPADMNGPGWFLLTAAVWLAHRESQQKSERLKSVWEGKRKRRDKPATTVCPRWLKHKGGKFLVVDDKADIVRRIFSLYLAGKSYQQIARLFNDEGIPPLAGKKPWSKGNVKFILTTRTVLGQYQPMTCVEASGKRKWVPVGEPIQQYPAIIDDGTFYRVQGCISQRRRSQGRKEHNTVNLFKGIIYDALCKGAMHVKNNFAKNKNGTQTYTYLVPDRAARDGKDWVSVSYQLVEAAFLAFVRELKLESAENGSVQAEIEKEEGIVQELTARLDRLNNEPDALDTLLPIIRTTTANLRAAEARLDALRRQAHDNQQDNLAALKQLAAQWDEHVANGTLDEFKEQLRNKIKSVVEAIWVLILPKSKASKTILLQVFLRAGGCRWVVIQTTGQNGAYIGSCVDEYIDPKTDLRLWKR